MRHNNWSDKTDLHLNQKRVHKVVTQHWDLIEARGFRKDTKDIRNNNVDDGEDVEDNDNNDEKNNTIPNQT